MSFHNIKIVYIAHPIGGDVAGNLAEIRRIYRELSLSLYDMVIPFCPYYAAVVSLDDSKPTERAMGMMHNREFFIKERIDELWLYGSRISEGMRAEIYLARLAGIPVIAKTPETAAALDLVY